MNKFTKQELRALQNELENLATSVGIPIHRCRDYKWLLEMAPTHDSPNKKDIAKIIKITQILAGENNG